MPEHAWCKDVPRDEAVRVAEDAAAAERTPLPDHRDLPQAVAELRERVASLEAVIPQSVSGSNAEAHENKGDTMQPGRIRAWNRENELTAERDAARAEAQRLSMANRTLVGVADALEARVSELKAAAKLDRDAARAEAERLRRPATWQEEEAAVEAAWSLCGLEPDWPSDEPGTIVRHAESMRREIGRLRDRVAELESAPAANAGGEARQEAAIYRAGQFAASEAQKGPNFTERESGLRTERVTPDWQRAKWDEALAIICDGGDWGRGNEFHPGTIAALVIWADREIDRLAAERDAAIRERDAARAKCVTLKARVAELESAPAAPVADSATTPQPPRGWLTAREREEVQWAADAAYDKQHPAEDTLRALLARSTPPKVRRPGHRGNAKTLLGIEVDCDNDWIAAIREAGGEVE